MRQIALIACCKDKLYAPGEGSAAAGKLYTGDLFCRQLAYTRRVLKLEDKDIFILSARYELVNVATVIMSYDLSLRDLTALGQVKWAERVSKAVVELMPRPQRVAIMGGQTYKVHLLPLLHRLKLRIQEVHPNGLGYGQQVQWYMQRTPPAPERGRYGIVSEITA
jgi:hypothetical protein